MPRALPRDQGGMSLFQEGETRLNLPAPRWECGSDWSRHGDDLPQLGSTLEGKPKHNWLSQTEVGSDATVIVELWNGLICKGL